MTGYVYSKKGVWSIWKRFLYLLNLGLYVLLLIEKDPITSVSAPLDEKNREVHTECNEMQEILKMQFTSAM